MVLKGDVAERVRAVVRHVCETREIGLACQSFSFVNKNNSYIAIVN